MVLAKDVLVLARDVLATDELVPAKGVSALGGEQLVDAAADLHRDSYKHIGMYCPHWVGLQNKGSKAHQQQM